MQRKQSAATVLDMPSALARRSDGVPAALDLSSIGVRQARTFRDAVSATGKFLLHFLEMAMAMMVGMAIFVPVKTILVGQGYVILLDRTSLDYQLWMNLFMVVPMVLWMRLRGCSWRDGAEMTAAMIVPPACVLLLCGVGISNLLPWFTPNLAGLAMFLGMLAIMLYRREMYIGGYSLGWLRQFGALPGHATR